MADCNSNPNSTCDNSMTISEFNTFIETLSTKLSTTNTKLLEVITAYNQRCEDTNINLGLVVTKLTTIVENGQDCCEEMINNYNNLINAFINNINPSATTTTTTVVPGTTTTTTTVAVPTTTTTTLPVTTTTTTITGETILSDYFTVSDDIDFVCQDPEVVCYWKGTWGVGTTMYSDALCLFKLTEYSYIRRIGEIAVYGLGYATAIVEPFVKNCES